MPLHPQIGQTTPLAAFDPFWESAERLGHQTGIEQFGFLDLPLFRREPRLEGTTFSRGSHETLGSWKWCTADTSGNGN